MNNTKSSLKIRYATALGLYDKEDFDGPPPFPYEEVVDASVARALEAQLKQKKTQGLRPELEVN